MAREVKEQEQVMSLLGHLREFQKRLTRAAIALILCSLASFFFSKKILVFFLEPMGDYPVIAPRPTTSISIFMKISLLAGVILATPYIAYQFLRFVTPGLTSQERRSLIWIVPGITISFLGGASFAYFVMVPAAIPFLLGFLSDVVQPTWMIDEYIPFMISLIFWVGVSFEMPLLCYFLAWLEIIDAKTLLRGWRIALILIAILSAGITPTPDPFNMMLVMLPLLLLYFFGIFLAWVAGRQKRKT